MSTIARYVIAAAVDPSGVKRGISDVIAQMDRLRRVSKERIKLEMQFPDLAKAEAAQKLIGNLQRQFEQSMAQNREGLFRGAIKPDQFKKEGVIAAQEFNKALLAGIDKLRSQKLITGDIHNQLIRQLKDAGLQAGTAFGKAAQRGVAAHPLLGNLTTTGQRAANTLLNGLNATYKARTNELKEQLVQGVINVQTFRRKGIEAAKEFDAGLNAGLQKLRGKNQATKDITEALIGSFKLAGLKAANSFALSLDKQLGENVTRMGQTMSRVVTLPVVAAGAASLKLAADFESSMLRVQAIVKPTAVQLERLAEQARYLGSVSQFSGKDAAQAMAALAQQHFNFAQITKAMPTITNLAASSFLDMTEAARISTSILRGYGIAVTDLEPKVDQMVKLTLIAATNIQDLGVAFSYVGPDARAAGQTFEDISTAIGVLARQGVPASRIGTALRGILNRLTSPTKQAAAALDDLGIKVRDSAGNMKSLIDIVGQFEQAQKRFHPADFADALGNIFEDRAGSGFKVLMLEGMEGLKQMRAEMDKAGGTAKELADLQMSGLTGAMRELRSAVEELLLALADSGLLRAFTNIVRGAAALILQMSKANPKLFQFATYAGIAAAALGPLAVAIGRTMVMMSLMRSAAILSGASVASIGTILAVGAPVLIGLGLLVALLVKVAQKAGEAQRKLAEFRGELVTRNRSQLEQMKRDIETSIKFNSEQLEALRKTQRTKSNNPFQTANRTAVELRRLLALQQGMLTEVNKTLKDLGDSDSPIAGISEDAANLANDIANAAGTLRLGLEDAVTPAEALENRITLLASLVKATGGNYRAIPGLVEAISHAQLELNTQLAETPNLLGKTGAQLLQLKQAIADITQDAQFLFPNNIATQLLESVQNIGPLELEVTPMIKTTEFRSDIQRTFDEFRRIAEKAAGDKLNLDMAKSGGDFIQQAVATDVYAKSLARAAAFEKMMANALLNSNLPAEEKRKLWEEINQLMARYKEQADKGTKSTIELSDTFNSIANGVRGIISIADAFGDMADGAREALEAVADLADSIGSFVASVASGNIAGAISSGIGVIGSVVKLFGAGSKADEEAKAIAKENSAALYALKQSVDGWAVTVANMSKAQPVIDATLNTIDRVLAAFEEKLGKKIDLSKVEFKSVEVLDRQLKDAGSSFAELKAIAEDLNINILNEKGRLSAAGLDALRKAMELQRQKLTQFGETLDAQRRKLELKRNVFNLDTSPVADLQDSINLLERFAPGIANMFAGIDASTRQGQIIMELKLQELFKMLEERLLDPDLFGSLEIEGISDIIKTMADAFDKLREKSNDASEALSGIPPGYKIERARWRALMTDAQQSMALMNNIVKNPIAINPPVVTVIPKTPVTVEGKDGVGTADAVPKEVVPTNVTLQFGNIIVTNPVPDGKTMYEEVQREAKARVTAKYGASAVKFVTQVMP